MSYGVINKFIIIFLQIFESEDNHYLFLFFTQKRFRQPLLINVCLISIQQFSSHFFLTNKFRCLHGVLTLSETIPNVTEILLLQVFLYFRIYNMLIVKMPISYSLIDYRSVVLNLNPQLLRRVLNTIIFLILHNNIRKCKYT